MARGLRWGVPLVATLLLAVFPLVSLFAHNQTEVELSVLWWPLVWCLGGAAATYCVFLVLARPPASAGVLASLVVVAFFYCGLFSEVAPSRRFLALWLGVFIVALVLVLLTKRDLFALTVIAVFGAAAMVLPQLASIVLYHVHHPAPAATDPRLWPTALETPTPPTGAQLPDIYVIMPDDYVRADILQQYFNYDDGAFIQQLEDRGFVVSRESRSPYSYSEMNMASLLNLDYLSRFPEIMGTTSMDMRPVKRVMEDNRASRVLATLGYDYVHLDTDEVTFAGRNPNISPLASPDSFMSLWLQGSILRSVGGSLGFDDAANNARFRDSARSVFSALADVPATPGPKFVVFHTLLPHDPYLFGPQGEAVTFPSEADHTGAVGMEYYLQQLEYVNGQILDAVDAIQARSATPPVILLQADEGFEVNENLFGEAATQDIRVKGLSAFNLPGHSGAGVPDPPNTVNDLRFVFNEYLGTHYPMLDTVSYPELDLLYQFDEIPVR
ncbi:MAG: hypothetical protein JWO11_2891 [Nocardioides sp.]|nr:hypothetical protein [Nocardioides sp.]